MTFDLLKYKKIVLFTSAEHRPLYWLYFDSLLGTKVCCFFNYILSGMQVKTWLLVQKAHLPLQTSWTKREKSPLLICPCHPLRLCWSVPIETVFTLLFDQLQTRKSLCWLHNFHAPITKDTCLGLLSLCVSEILVISSLRVKGRSGSVDCGGWQSRIVCELVLLHKGPIVESGGPERGDRV